MRKNASRSKHWCEGLFTAFEQKCRVYTPTDRFFAPLRLYQIPLTAMELTLLAVSDKYTLEDGVPGLWVPHYERQWQFMMTDKNRTPFGCSGYSGTKNKCHRVGEFSVKKTPAPNSHLRSMSSLGFCARKCPLLYLWVLFFCEVNKNENAKEYLCLGLLRREHAYAKILSCQELAVK